MATEYHFEIKPGVSAPRHGAFGPPPAQPNAAAAAADAQSRTLLHPPWSIADDVFWERYGPAPLAASTLTHVRVLSNQFHAPPPPPLVTQNEPFLKGPTPAIDPWLLQSRPFASPGEGPAAPGPRRRMLFQYKPYCRQDALRLGEEEVAAAVEAAFGKIRLDGGPGGAAHAVPPDQEASSASPGGQQQQYGCGRVGSPQPRSLGNNGGMEPVADVASVVLIKLVIDMYLGIGPEAAFAMVHHLLMQALLQGDAAAKARVFDLIFNLSVHGELLYDAPADRVAEDDSMVAETVAGLDGSWRSTVTSAMRASLAVGLEGGPTRGHPPYGIHSHKPPPSDATAACGSWPPLPPHAPSPDEQTADPRNQRFRQWLRLLLFSALSALDSGAGPADGAWAAAVSCLAALTVNEGRVVRAYVEELPLGALAALLRHAQAQAWAPALQCWLSVLAANLLYTSDGVSGLQAGRLDAGRLNAFGGIDAVVCGYLEAPTARSQRAFFCVMFDFVADSWRGGRAGADSLSAQVDALAAGFLGAMAAETMHALLRLPQDDARLERVSAEICRGIPSLDCRFAAECLRRLQDLATAVVAREQVTPPTPALLSSPVNFSASAAESNSGDDGSSMAEHLEATLRGDSGAEHWEALVRCMLDPSCRRAAESWLLKLLISTANSEAAAGRSPTAVLPPSPFGSIAVPADTFSGTGQALAMALQRALGDPSGGGIAAAAFMDAVAGFVDFARIQAAGLGGPQERKPERGWGAADAPVLALTTLTLAVEWLGIVRQREGQKQAMVAAAECVVGVITVRQMDPSSAVAEEAKKLAGNGAAVGEAAPLHNGGLSSAPGGAAVDLVRAALLRRQEDADSAPSALESAAFEATATISGGTKSPLAKIVPVKSLAGAWRRLTAPHASKHASTPGEEPEMSPRPLSAGMAAFTPSGDSSPSKSAAGGGGGGFRASGTVSPISERAFSPYPGTSPRQHYFSGGMGSGNGGSGPSSLLALAAQRAAVEWEDASAAAQDARQALAHAEARVTAVESFLAGLSGAPPALLRAAPPALLRRLFDVLRAENLAPRPSAAAADSQGRNVAVQAGREVWDARAAVGSLLLLSASSAPTPTSLYSSAPPPDLSHSVKSPAAAVGQPSPLSRVALDCDFLAEVLADPDPRVRRQASLHALGQFATVHPERYWIAVQSVLARAQRGDDERLLCSPETQLRAMLEGRAVTLEELAATGG